MSRPRLNQGLVQVYTGNGKGKTTASLGLALRAIGHGYKVFMLQFMKGSKDYGEIQAAEKYLPNLIIVQSGLETFVSKENPSRADIDLARQGLETARKVISEGHYDLVILDEINTALDFNLIELDDVLDIIKSKPRHVELVLTGRYVPQKITEVADLVSEVNLIKHPYYHGVAAREGIEY
ncbi:cob(I)yrinic acid a,c-diamide adenosyltransferase [Desulfallas thermosapovorans]|uniref:Cob(I)alamin adenosyltransferase n=1 Tax=Desulfallas thermosapovorans DSM 6562 TaxID=1121431 RepID=A0A5S4ZY43_9FIRM|nr:cob(I)yrinic acid a,c-diamide adenosyltransferase [Desulfallas thermosapovorans]TYO97828.1 cob(I)alamin adenosyltransferase [Desulfallas thermosapovorans DSM 6562]